MTTYYKATFSNGQTLTRSTAAGRTYSHCYITGRSSGWARSPVHAHKAMTAWRSYQAEGGEIAPAVEITAQEYRALKRNQAEKLADKRIAEQHAQRIRQLEFMLEKADYGMGMPRDYQRVLELRAMLEDARKAAAEASSGPKRCSRGVET